MEIYLRKKRPVSDTLHTNPDTLCQGVAMKGALQHVEFLVS